MVADFSSAYVTPGNVPSKISLGIFFVPSRDKLPDELKKIDGIFY